MNKRLLLLSICLIWSIQVFAQSYEIDLPIYAGEQHLGDVKASVQDDKLLWLDQESLLSVLSPHIKEDTIAQFERLDKQVKLDKLPLPLKYNPEELKLDLTLKVNQRSTNKLNLMEDYRERYRGEALDPAPFAGAINYRLEQNFANRNKEQEYFGTQFNSFINMNTLVLESQTYYQSNVDNKWFRSDTRLVKDFENKQVRVQAGDIYPQLLGFMTPRPLGGVNISRNFSLNPYRLPYPTGSQEFTLHARSMVKYFVNGSLIRSEYLPAGNYSARDIPLNNGLNTILIEATDELGQKKVFVFRSSTSINLLNESESRFDLSHGIPFMDQNFKREYMDEEGKVTSGFYQYGLSSSFSAAVYGQNQKDFSLLGSDIIQATPIGNFSAGYASSHDADFHGDAQSLSYQLIGQGMEGFFSHTLGLRYEHRGEEFKTSITDLASVIQNNYAANYTVPLASMLTVSVGGNYGDVRNNALSDRYGFDSTLNLRILNHHNLSFFVGRTRDENKIWNDVAYVFLTITFPDSNDFVSVFHDQQQDSSKLTYIKDNQNRLYQPRAQGIVENSKTLQSGEVDVLVPTPFGDYGARLHGDHIIEGDRVDLRGSVRLNSAFVFAYDEGELGLGISRPITNSFVLFKPEQRLKDQRIALRSTSPFAEAESGLFNEITFNNLLAYQYREVQLDPSLMEEGRTLTREKYVVFPTYRSGHLIKLEEKGAVILRGTLRRPDGTPWSLQVGQLSGQKPFFTNRDGEFFIEGVEPGRYELRLDGNDSGLVLEIKDKERGLKDVGDLVLEAE